MKEELKLTTQQLRAHGVVHINIFPSVVLLLSTTLGAMFPVQSEKITLNKLDAPASTDNIYVQKIASDKNSTDFFVVIKKSVPLHKHASHTETIYVLTGRAIFQQGNNKFEIGPGDYLRIPEGTPHAVKVISSEPLKVLSIQAPEFFGKDRIAIEGALK